MFFYRSINLFLNLTNPTHLKTLNNISPPQKQNKINYIKQQNTQIYKTDNRPRLPHPILNLDTALVNQPSFTRAAHMPSDFLVKPQMAVCTVLVDLPLPEPPRIVEVRHFRIWRPVYPSHTSRHDNLGR